MADFAGVYRITNIVNGKVYIGSSVNVKKRLKQHAGDLAANRHRNPYLQNAWSKYGAAVFVFEPLLVCSTKLVLFYEQRLIEGYESANREKGYNSALVAGSNFGLKRSAETKAKISAAKKGTVTSAATKAKLRAANVGRVLSAEFIANMGKIALGHVHSEETKAKISATKTGKPGHAHTEEAKAKISRSHMGIVPSAESREKMRASRNAYVARMLKENGN